ncbi:Bug family tripartite tricarboxylate transporter substrate binding protein [Humitalea sp. 24SJ18S-53]|uniref:Bug family tripartite tricarboxylate transporter substrate binding protein n=1 Tax=Humitalea sp. 24SJ18S-53 TaxID=3422307 RepID=UPI003D66AF0B
MKIDRRALLASSAALAAAGTARAQGMPDGQLRIIVPAPPGAFNDGLARLLADRLGPMLGQTAVVDNRVGAGGMLGTKDIVQARPDGRTIGIANTATMAINPHLFANAGFDPLTDLTPIASCARIMIVLVASPKLGVSSVAELIAMARARPGALDYASAGVGGSTHLAFELLKLRSGIDLTHVPYRGAAPVATALLAGDIPVGFEGVPLLLPHIRSGALKALAVSGATRHPQLPEVPTMQEAGVANYEMAIWFGLVAPNGMAAPIRERLSAATLRALAEPEMVDKIAQQGAEVWARDGASFAAFVRAEHAKLGEVVRAANIKVE